MAANQCPEQTKNHCGVEWSDYVKGCGQGPSYHAAQGVLLNQTPCASSSFAALHTAGDSAALLFYLVLAICEIV